MKDEITGEIKQAKQLAYARGYQAGRKRRRRDMTIEQMNKHRDANWNRAFLAALPTCIDAQGWKRGDKPINSLEARVRLARDFADEAMKYMR